MSSFALKFLAILLMTIDHVGLLLFPTHRILRAIGRLAFPIFAFQIGVGFKHTHSKEKYILRMILFTLISQYPFTLFLNAVKIAPILNIGATFTLALLALYSIDKFKKSWVKYPILVIIACIATYVPMDYGIFGVLIVISLYFLDYSKVIGMSSFFSIVLMHCAIDKSIFSLPALLALFPILLYNGKKGPNIKYLFYVFYPLHMLILLLIKDFVL